MIDSRAAAALGLGMVGVVLLVGPTLGQQDAAVRRSNAQAAAASAKMPVAAVIGTCDLGAVLKGYDKAKVLGEELRSAEVAKEGELMKLQNERQQEMEMLEKVAPGSAEFKKRQDKISQLKAQFDASREQAQRDFSMREAEMMMTLYKEAQDMISRVAASRKYTLILQTQNPSAPVSNMNVVMAVMSRSVMYSDPQNDITRDVTYYLNKQYKDQGGVAPKESTGAAAKAAPAGSAPAGRQ